MDERHTLGQRPDRRADQPFLETVVYHSSHRMTIDLVRHQRMDHLRTRILLREWQHIAAVLPGDTIEHSSLRCRIWKENRFKFYLRKRTAGWMENQVDAGRHGCIVTDGCYYFPTPSLTSDIGQTDVECSAIAYSDY
jgi:hypothetical protein